MARPKSVWSCCTYQWRKSPRKIICPEFCRNRFVYLQTHLLMQAIAKANKQLLPVVMQDNELTSPWSNHFKTVPNVFVYGKKSQNHLARNHTNPLGDHTINSARTNIAWDKYKTPISILKPPDRSTMGKLTHYSTLKNY